MDKQQEANGPTADGRPSWLPPKFKTPEDLAKSYTELEKYVGTIASKKPAETPEVQPKTPEPQEDPVPSEGDGLIPQLEVGTDDEPPVPEVDPEANSKALRAAIDKASKGGLDPETLEALTKTGIPREEIERIATELKTGAEARRQLEAQVYEATIMKGIDADDFKEATEWAKDNLLPEEIAAFDRAVSSGDPHVGRLAVRGLMSQFRESEGPILITGERAADGGDVFESHEQITEAQSDPRYEKDPAYRAKIEAKIIRSDYSKFRR